MSSVACSRGPGFFKSRLKQFFFFWFFGSLTGFSRKFRAWRKSRPQHSLPVSSGPFLRALSGSASPPSRPPRAPLFISEFGTHAAAAPSNVPRQRPQPPECTNLVRVIKRTVTSSSLSSPPPIRPLHNPPNEPRTRDARSAAFRVGFRRGRASTEYRERG